MKFSDVLAFAKAGYTPADVKALMELEDSQESSSTESNEENHEESEENHEENFQEQEENHGENHSSDSELEELKKKNAELEKLLKESQQSNVNQNLANENKTDINTQAIDIIKGFF